MTPDQIAFIKAHWNVDMSGPDIADEMGIEYERLRKSVTYLRRTGH